MPDIHPKIADIYRRKVERLAEALADPRDRDEAAEAIRGLIERIVLTPGEMHAALHGDLGTILEWAGSGSRKGATDTPARGMPVSVVAGAGFKPAGIRLSRRRGYGMLSGSEVTLDFGQRRHPDPVGFDRVGVSFGNDHEQLVEPQEAGCVSAATREPGAR